MAENVAGRMGTIVVRTPRMPSRADRPAWCEASALLCLARDVQRAGQEAVCDGQEDGDEEDCSPLLLAVSRSMPELNLAVGLRSTDYDEQQYLDLLCACGQAYAARATALETAHGQPETLRQEVHALRGSLGIIGAEALHATAGEIEMAILDRHMAAVGLMLPQFIRDVRALARKCADVVRQGSALSAMTAYPPLWRDTLRELRSCAMAYDYSGALSLLAALEWAHAPQDGPWLTAMRRALETFDYQALVGLVRDLPMEA